MHPNEELALEDASIADEPLLVLAPANRPRATEARPKIDVYEHTRLARQALVAGEAQRALDLLAEVPSAHQGLREQRAATEIAALCRLDRKDQARAVLDALAARSPDSPLVDRLQHACW